MTIRSLIKPVILVDCDDVLADFATPALKLVAELGGPELTPETRFQWEIGELLKDNPEAKNKFWDTLCEPGWCSKLATLPGAPNAIRELQKLGEVVIVTSPLKRSPTWQHERENWLWEIFGIERSHIVNSSNKRWVHGQFMADDKPENLHNWPHGSRFLIAYHYNRHETSFMRGSLADFVAFVEDMS